MSRRRHIHYRKNIPEEVGTTVTSIHMDRRLWELVGHLAINERKPKAQVLNEAVTHWLKHKRMLPAQKEEVSETPGSQS